MFFDKDIWIREFGNEFQACWIGLALWCIYCIWVFGVCMYVHKGGRSRWKVRFGERSMPNPTPLKPHGMGGCHSSLRDLGLSTLCERVSDVTLVNTHINLSLCCHSDVNGTIKWWWDNHNVYFRYLHSWRTTQERGSSEPGKQNNHPGEARLLWELINAMLSLV